MLDVFGQLVVLLFSLIVLSIASKYVIEKAIRLSKFFGISEFAIGFILVATLTSLPELSIAVTSSVSGNNNISLGDVLGSNITNIALILGLGGFLGFKRKFSKKETNNMLILIFISLIPLVVIIDGELSYFDGSILLIFFVAFIYFVFSKKTSIDEYQRISKIEAAKDFLIFIISTGLVIVSAGFAVRSAVYIADKIGIFESFIGATIIALGTSLPELAVNIAAAKKGKDSLALGNVLGSGVTNLTLVLGVNTILNPFTVNINIVSSLIVFLIITSVGLAYILWRHNKVEKMDGLILLGIYVIYIFSISGVQIFELVKK